jgi:uncharacterized protein involved in type VI secretion and phage assembly
MEFDDPEALRYLGLYDGTVVDNADPLLLGRVRVMIPGLIEPDSAWAEPVGKASGSAQTGDFDVPEMGATVTVQFLMGDPDRPKYQGGHWGKPGGKSEAPTYAQTIAPKDAHLVRIIETKAFDIVLDSRGGQEQMFIRRKPDGTVIRLRAKSTDHPIQLGSESADEAIMLGTSYRTAEKARLQNDLAALASLVAASQGPLSALQPGFQALMQDITVFTQAGATTDFLSKVAFSEYQ